MEYCQFENFNPSCNDNNKFKNNNKINNKNNNHNNNKINNYNNHKNIDSSNIIGIANVTAHHDKISTEPGGLRGISLTIKTLHTSVHTPNNSFIKNDDIITIFS